MVPLYDVSALPNYAKAWRKVSSFIRENKSLSLYFKNLSINTKKLIFVRSICNRNFELYEKTSIDRRSSSRVRFVRQ
jgi:hypothetical protein